jgi:hypothetical protein
MLDLALTKQYIEYFIADLRGAISNSAINVKE